jgi:hypothetical protein
MLPGTIMRSDGTTFASADITHSARITVSPGSDLSVNQMRGPGYRRHGGRVESNAVARCNSL